MQKFDLEVCKGNTSSFAPVQFLIELFLDFVDDGGSHLADIPVGLSLHFCNPLAAVLPDVEEEQKQLMNILEIGNCLCESIIRNQFVHEEGAIEDRIQKLTSLHLAHIELHEPLWKDHAVTGRNAVYWNLCTTDFMVALPAFPVFVQLVPHDNFSNSACVRAAS